jgi:hypothetical protein
MDREEKRRMFYRKITGRRFVQLKFDFPLIPEQLRKENIESYSKHVDEPCAIGVNMRNNIKAYEQMSDAEILMSEQRYRRGDSSKNYLNELDEFEKRSGKLDIRAKARVA